ncbi:MAG: DNA adenine methylase [Moorea sp. SIO2B7]|nr:DNA adenine methylase [Moorena sp. SIO2B7]
MVKPFLKWAGGKGQLLKQMDEYFPSELASGCIKRYIEPFVGGGAVFLYLAQLYPIDEFFISDINRELVLSYNTIQKNVESLIKVLGKLQDKYLSLDELTRKEYYYHIRSQFNFHRQNIDFQRYGEEWIEITAQMIFLNRTCFNGLFRVNSKGDFNVPVGRYKNPRICDSENLQGIAEILKKTKIYHGDFTACQEFVNAHTFVYFDPPYKPISNTANFTSYAKQNFDDSEQLRLRDFFGNLDQKGAKLMLSNSAPKDYFFEFAYKGYRIERVKARRNINSKAEKRGKIDELLMMNY